MLILLRSPVPQQDAAQRLGLPDFRIRATVRELGKAQLIREAGTGWVTTDLGEEALTLDAESRALGH